MAAKKIKIYDLIIIGGGPSGATCGFYADNLETLIIDKFNFPRHKACGGGLLNCHNWPNEFKNFKNIYPRLTKHPINSSAFYYNNKLIASRADNHYFDQVSRAEFDNLLLQETLKKKNISFQKFHAKSIKKIILNNKKILCLSDGKSGLFTKKIVGADGANSLASRFLGNKNFNIKNSARCVGYEIKTEKHQDQTCRLFYLWDREIGYSWIFPTKTGYNIGIGILGKCQKNIQKMLDNFIVKCQKNKILPEKFIDKKIFGGTVPLQSKLKFCNKNIFLCGDAMGLVYQLNGEGIYFAMKSGKIAGQIISQEKKSTYRYKLKILKTILTISFIPFFPPKKILIFFTDIVFISILQNPLLPKKIRILIENIIAGAITRRLFLSKKSVYKKL